LRAAREELLRIDEVWIRRTATGCFPNATDSLSSAGVLQNFAIIETGARTTTTSSTGFAFSCANCSDRVLVETRWGLWG
jgi:hypothetical protein